MTDWLIGACLLSLLFSTVLSLATLIFIAERRAGTAVVLTLLAGCSWFITSRALREDQRIENGEVVCREVSP